MIDSIRAVRRGVLIAMKNDPHLNELLPADHIYSQTPPLNPPWPFSTYQTYGQTRPITGTCIDGQELTPRVHVYGQARKVAGITVETAEDFTCRILERLGKTLDKRRLIINQGYMTIAFIGSYVEVDRDEADAFHGWVSMRIRCITTRG